MIRFNTVLISHFSKSYVILSENKQRFYSFIYSFIHSFIHNCYMSLRKKCWYSELFWFAFFPHFPAFRLNTERYSWIDGCFYRKRFFTTNHFFQMQEKLEMCQNSNFTNPKRHVLKDHFLEMNIINEYNKYI